MIEGLRPYSEMKPSGVPWLGEIPTHWETRRNGRLFGPRRETGFPDLPVLEVSIRSGVRVRDMEGGARKQAMSDRAKYQRAVRGDITYNMMRMWQGAVGVAPTDGLVSPAYVVARPFEGTNPAFFAYQFRTAAYMREVETFSRGIVSDRNRLYWESFKQMPSVYPPPGDQKLIVRFLDWHGSRSAGLVRAKRKLLALLNEQKQISIQWALNGNRRPDGSQRAVQENHDLDPQSRWQSKRFKFLTQIRNGQVDPRLDEYRYRILIAPNHVEAGSGRIVGLQTAEQQGADSGKYLVEKGDIVYSKIRPHLRKAIISPVDGLCSADMYPIKLKSDDVTPEFLLNVMLGAEFTRYAVNCSMRVAMPKINRDALGNFWVRYPERSEQHSLIKKLSDEALVADRAADGILSEIGLLRDFHARLVADVVTGKLDVLAIAATLPEVDSAEPEPDDEALDDQEDVDVEKEEAAA